MTVAKRKVAPPLTPAEVPGRIQHAVLSHLSYKPTVKGESATVPLLRAARVQFEDAAPVRQPMAYQGSGASPVIT